MFKQFFKKRLNREHLKLAREVTEMSGQILQIMHYNGDQEKIEIWDQINNQAEQAVYTLAMDEQATMPPDIASMFLDMHWNLSKALS